MKVGFSGQIFEQISWKSVQWEPSVSMRTDRRAWRTYWFLFSILRMLLEICYISFSLAYVVKFIFFEKNVCYYCKCACITHSVYIKTVRWKRYSAPLYRHWDCTGRTAHRVSRGIALLFLDHGTRRGWGVSVTPRPLFTPGKEPVPIVQEAIKIHVTSI